VRGGARPAEPGEFTRRAFMNGRIDMLQAEAILDLVRAQSDMAATQAVEQMEGGLSREVNAIYDEVLNASAQLEATLDFSEEDVPEPVMRDIFKHLSSAVGHMDTLCATWEEGRILREGLRVVIAGRPNAGKSSLFNLLLDTPRAIVHTQAGTTRDTIEEAVQWAGLPIRLVDTAGLRESACEIEQEGVRRSHAQRAAADLVLFVVDVHAPPHPDECALIAARPARRLILGNKADLGRHPGWDTLDFSNEIQFAIATDPNQRTELMNRILIVWIASSSCITGRRRPSPRGTAPPSPPPARRRARRWRSSGRTAWPARVRLRSTAGGHGSSGSAHRARLFAGTARLRVPSILHREVAAWTI
jgi:tRNA modification GTPase TrmE